MSLKSIRPTADSSSSSWASIIRKNSPAFDRISGSESNHDGQRPRHIMCLRALPCRDRFLYHIAPPLQAHARDQAFLRRPDRTGKLDIESIEHHQPRPLPARAQRARSGKGCGSSRRTISAQAPVTAGAPPRGAKDLRIGFASAHHSPRDLSSPSLHATEERNLLLKHNLSPPPMRGRVREGGVGRTLRNGEPSCCNVCVHTRVNFFIQ